MTRGFDSFRPRQEQSKSSVKVLTRPDGIKAVELVTPIESMIFILKDGRPYITSSTGTLQFNKLSSEDQRLVIETLQSL